MHITTHQAFQRADMARHGITLAQAEADPLYRRLLRCVERAEQRRHARAQAKQASETHQKGSTE